MNGNKALPHRGRFQAQGGRGSGIEESEPWAQISALTAQMGHQLLTTLENKLGTADRAIRQSGFGEARNYIDDARRAKGVGPIKKSFPKKPNPDNERVDLEVHKGRAFVP